MKSHDHDAVVVGSGPNGLAAAITLAQAGQRVVVLEAALSIGGGLRTQELTLPGFRHDVCSAVHPLGVASPFFQSLPLERHGLRWLHPNAPLAHPLDHHGQRAVMLERDLLHTASALGADERAYRQLFAALERHHQALLEDILRPLLHWPTHPLVMMQFGIRGLWSANTLARNVFQTPEARALFAGLAAHSVLPLEAAGTSAIASVLGALGHAVGWPFPAGGAQSLADALTAHLHTLGAQVLTNVHIKHWRDLPTAKTILLDVPPRTFLELAGPRLPSAYRTWLERYRHGAGVFKLDYALSQPIPWSDPSVALAGTVHIGGGMDEIAHAESQVARGQHPEKPFVLLAQHSLFDQTRAPAGKHTAWAYCHVPNGSKVDMTAQIENQIERFAPGFRDCVIARHAMNTKAMQLHNPNYIGGDVNGGSNTLWQLLARPLPSFTPYRTPLRGVYLCSASTPPGGGVHGMCGHLAARTAIRDLVNRRY